MRTDVSEVLLVTAVVPAIITTAVITTAVIAAAVVAKPDIARPTVNLANGWVGIPDGRAWPFALEEEARTMLLEGLDAIELTLKRAAEIVAFLDRDRALRPWVYL